ncbi:MAG: aromatic amino acid transport family protein [Patescibacteria group bacterium]
MNKRFFHAIAMMVGMIVGVGLFGVPYAVEKVGFALGATYIFILGMLLLLVHVLYGEVALRTEGKHRLVGYAEIYLGSKGKIVAALAQIFSFYGALIAYIIIGGQFLHLLLSPVFGGTILAYQIGFFIVTSLTVGVGLRLVAPIEFAMTMFLLAVVAIIFIFGLSYVWYPNLFVMNLKEIFFPYGVILFALGGAAAVPEIRDLLRGQEKKMKKALIWGTAIPIVITILFSFVVIGISGENTTSEAISGLVGPLGSNIVLFGAIFGFLAITTSFLVLGLNLKEIFKLDYKVNGWLSWLLACLVPFIIFLLARPEFISVAAFTGAVLGGIEGLLIILIWLKAEKEGKRTPEYKVKISEWVLSLVAFVFILGIIYKVIYPEF